MTGPLNLPLILDLDDINDRLDWGFQMNSGQDIAEIIMEGI